MSDRKPTISIMLIFLFFSFSFEDCNPGCKTCLDANSYFNDKNMTCTSCADGLFFIANTSNCVNKTHFPDYYLNITESILYPCSSFNESNCYECDPYLKTKGICLSCNRGYIYNNDTNECKKCEKGEYAIIINDFDNCYGDVEDSYCDKFITSCKKLESLENEEIICPEEAPIFDNITKSCNEYECVNSGIKDGICYPSYEKYKDKILFINWLNDPQHKYYIRNPNYFTDNTDLLMIELTYEPYFSRERFFIEKTNQRKFYFLNEEGRGLFDEINDISEKSILLSERRIRLFSSSIVFKSNENNKYRYFLNFESYNFNFEFLDIETGELTVDNYDEIFDLGPSAIGMTHINYALSWTQMTKWEEENQFILNFYSYIYTEDTFSSYDLRFWLSRLKLNQNIKTKNGKRNVYSLEFMPSYRLSSSIFNVNKRFYTIKIGKDIIYISMTSENNYLCLIKVYYTLESQNSRLYKFDQIFKDNFHKLLFIKENIFLLCYNSNENPPYYNYFNFFILKHLYDVDKFTELFSVSFIIDYKEGRYIQYTDIIMLTENKAAFVALKWHGRAISINIIDFVDNYNEFMANEFHLNFYGQKIINKEQNSLIFKYRNFLGLHFENIDGEYGFILFGYFNSTDPKQIYDIKKDGLNYIINLGSYLTLQSNVFGYKKKCIRIIEVPNLNKSGIYLISNETKNMIKKDNCLNLNTEIKLNFAYNGIIKKGNYLFKFCGVLEEQTLEEIYNYSDSFDYGFEEFDEKYIEFYNEQRNLNITGRVALVQINVLNDIKVFCDDKYNNTSLKSKEGISITCGDGEFFNIINANEITQLDLGNKYYYDINKKIYIKCHERCKKCSKEYNDTNMNCDECYENYFLLNGACLEIPKCEYNYYYDIDLNLECINRDNYCPNFKPYENNETKECIEKCDISELNDKKCNPTNTPVSINETYKIIVNNTKYLNIEEKLLKNKEEFSIIGNNVSFIFSTTEIEKKNLYNKYNGSSIILNKCEDILKTCAIILVSITI